MALVDECTSNTEVLAKIAVFALALPTVEDYVIMEMRPTIVAVSAAFAVRIFDKFHPVPVNTEDISVQLLNTIHTEVLPPYLPGTQEQSPSSQW